MAKKYKCPYCEKRLIRKDLINHIDKSHKELIPEKYTASRLVYDQVNKVNSGRCRVCGKPTTWSENSGRYNVLCDNPKCKEYMREQYKKNMLRVRGTYNILNDPEQQKRMLANRSISGKYKFQDGGEHIYTGSYEKKCLEFMDIVMQIPSKDILSPGPTLEYEYEGQKHFYITDFYYIPYNLIIEVKDGGSNLNTKDSASMRASREKTIEKEHIITDRGEYNYIRLTDNNFAQLIEVFMIIKEKLLEGDDSKTYKINESQIILEGLFGYSYYIKAGTEKTTKCFYDSTIITKKAAVYCAISSNIQSKLQANGYMPGYENKYKITIVKAGNYAFENKKFTLYKVNKKDEIGTGIETMTLKEFADKYKIKYEIDSRDANDLAKIKKEIKRVQGFIKTEFNKYSIFKKYEMETEMYNEEESIEAYANRQQHDVNIVMIHCPYSRLNDESEMKKLETAGESLIKNVNNKILPDSKIIVEWDHLNMLISLKMLKGYTESQVVLKDYFVESNNQLYHISNKKGITNINPSIPNNFMTKNGYEENKTKRVCFAPSVDQCLMGLSRNCEGEEFYVYAPDGDYKTYTPSIKEVPDVKITGEVWIKEPVNVKCVGKIKVLDTNKSPGKSYSYGNNQTAELYAFDYKWVKNINESQIILEDYFVDKKDIYYNKDKFDSGEINLCFITGLSGSGKTTMGKTMQSGNIEVYELDDIISNWNFSDANLKEYGSLVYSFFKGPGKMYRYTSYDEWMNDSKWDNPTNPYANSYDAMIIKDFIKYAKLYANFHKNIKFVLEGVWVFYFIDPKELDNCAVYIKGTSVLISFIRSAKRDCQDANSNMEKFGSFIKMVTSIGRMKGYLSNEKRLLQFYEYFASKVIDESQVFTLRPNLDY